MENNQKITYGILGVLTLVIAAFGGSMYLTEDELDHAYVCSVNENVGFFDRLSSTSKTGYYVDENGDNKRKVCTNGEWIPLREYAEARGITIDQLLQPKEIEVQNNYTGSAVKYRCNQKECVRI